jgi:hypothetical protein
MDSMIARFFFQICQQIDGTSLLLMKRDDVVRNMGLKLGLAVKIYKHIRRLQTHQEEDFLSA